MSQIILFGCPLELQADGKLPPVLEYLFDSFGTNQHLRIFSMFSVSSSIKIIATNPLIENAQHAWSFVNEIERAWTGVEASDRAFISKYNSRGHHKILCVGLLLSFAPAENLYICRHISMHFQTQCFLLKPLQRFDPFLQTRFGILGAKTPSRQLLPELSFLVKPQWTTWHLVMICV